MATRTEYSAEFKQEAVRLAENSPNKIAAHGDSAVARQLGIQGRWYIG